MKKSKSNLDEMQEQKLLKIEKNGFWILFWGLVISIYVQLAIGHGGFEYIGGEAVILIAVSVYLLEACIKNGIWDRKLKPNFKTNIILSLAAALFVGIFWFIVSYYRYHALAGSFATFAVMFISVGVLTFAMLSIFSGIYKARKSKLDEKADEEEFEE